MIISIEGNIGSGKSTVINYLKTLNDDRIVFVDEPVSDWINIKDNTGMNALECFYSDQKKNSFCFQVLAYITRLKKLMDIIKEHKDKIIITERSIDTDRNVFAKMLYESGMLSSIEWVTYNYWFDTFTDISKVDLKIYIKATPEKCFERINTRNRVEEESIKIDYLVNCNNYHNNWLDNCDNVKVIDGHNTVNYIRNEVVQIINSL